MAYHLLQSDLPCSWYGGMLVIYMGSHILGLPQWLSGKESACNTGEADSILQLGRSPVNGNPFRYSCLKNPMCRWAWRLQSSGLQRVGHNWAWAQGIFYLVPSCLHLLKCIICSLILSYYTHQGIHSAFLLCPFSSCEKWKRKPLNRTQLFGTPWTVHGILQARTLEWVAVSFSWPSSQPRDWIQVSCTASGFFTSWATREANPIKRGF